MRYERDLREIFKSMSLSKKTGNYCHLFAFAISVTSSWRRRGVREFAAQRNPRGLYLRRRFIAMSRPRRRRGRRRITETSRRASRRHHLRFDQLDDLRVETVYEADADIVSWPLARPIDRSLAVRWLLIHFLCFPSLTGSLLSALWLFGPYHQEDYASSLLSSQPYCSYDKLLNVLMERIHLDFNMITWHAPELCC